MPDSCRKNCKHFGFAPFYPGKKPSGQYGDNWWCKYEEKRIKNADSKCEQWMDRYKILVKKLPAQ